MLPLLALSGLMLVLSGCARNTIENRKQERYGAYSALPPETRQLVDAGQIKVGMSMDAVYIAWGKPDQVLNSETAETLFITWLYEDTRSSRTITGLIAITP
ncbi:MAG: hypothetical protein HC814_02545, partial [Rhodobacteraceae bacterium]|nr:hypothetical protein [Paracoccaceae bacterium]